MLISKVCRLCSHVLNLSDVLSACPIRSALGKDVKNQEALSVRGGGRHRVGFSGAVQSLLRSLPF